MQYQKRNTENHVNRSAIKIVAEEITAMFAQIKK